ncbi:MAG: class II aldolase/adducin family protein [Verrucomicrobiae bacterium]|nr:class II aldolase/adducin family protein [Verrucomicrobiae bacterium]
MNQVSANLFRAFLKAAHQIANVHRLVQCSSGNLSWRVDADRILISGTRAWLGELRKEQVAVVRLRDGALLSGCSPSVETGFHVGVMKARPDINVVLHFQTPFVTTVACRRDAARLNFHVIPEIPYYVGPIAFVPYLRPGSTALASAVIGAMKTHQMAVLRNHGAVTVGKTFHEAIQRAVFFELACEVVLHGGRRLGPIPKRELRWLLQHGEQA